MKLTKQQRAAIAYLCDNPQASPFEIAREIGTSLWGPNPYSFVGRLVENGAVRLVPTDEAKEVISDDDVDQG